ncbi:MAG: AMP-binding protein [Clostridia bacterium]|nr:AMP-binding protein [Clostridia bacterium]
MSEIKAPWLENYGEVKFHLDYHKGTMYDGVMDSVKRLPDFSALKFMGRRISYSYLAAMIDKVAASFVAMGVKPGMVVTICLPNVPQAVYCLYALNKIGAVASMIHPLSAVGEIEFYLKEVESRFVVTLDQFYDKLSEVISKVPVNKLIITSVADELSFVMSVGYKLTQGKNNPKVATHENVIVWKDFLSAGDKITVERYEKSKREDCAVILFSGGTTGTTKAIALSNLNFNALALQTCVMCNRDIEKTSMLAAMPIFHGFGLGVCIHTMMIAGGTSILVPRFNVKEYAELIKKNRPNYIAGVPTLFEAISRSASLDGVKLDCLMGVFSGGDSLSIELKKKIDGFLKDHGATIRVREGYGTTECVTASCLTPYHIEREGSIGFPYPDTYYKICETGTTDEVPYGQEGEICLTGPSVMLGYINKPDENAITLRKHADGHVWLHTGDLGVMDSEGFIYFKQRIKRMIITSGYNVYPSQIENVIDAHDSVQYSCVIGVNDEYKMQKVKAYVVLKQGIVPTDALKEELLEHCRRHIAKYAMPYEIEFRSELPKTLVGKIAYTVLEKEAMSA